MDQPRGPTNKKVPATTLGGGHRDNLGEAIDCNCLRPHHTKSPSEIQTKHTLRKLLAQFDSPSEPLPLPPGPTGTGSLSILIDQALSRYQHHKEIADYHSAEAEKHKAVLDELSRLVPIGRYR